MTRGARRELYEDMTRFLVDQWGPTKLLSHAGD